MRDDKVRQGDYTPVPTLNVGDALPSSMGVAGMGSGDGDGRGRSFECGERRPARSMR